jgi:hypothetical protein
VAEVLERGKPERLGSGIRAVSTGMRAVSTGMRAVSTGMRAVSTGMRAVSTGVRECVRIGLTHTGVRLQRLPASGCRRQCREQRSPFDVPVTPDPPGESHD